VPTSHYFGVLVLLLFLSYLLTATDQRSIIKLLSDFCLTEKQSFISCFDLVVVLQLKQECDHSFLIKVARFDDFARLPPPYFPMLYFNGGP
jgi:hypothetical protein